MTDLTRTCDVCGEGVLARIQYLEDVEYHGRTGKVLAQSSVCNHCGIDIADKEDSLFSRREWNRFRKIVDDIPRGADIKEMRTRARLTQQQASDLFGGGAIGFSRYENDDVIPDAPMVNLLRLAVAFPDTVFRLQQLRRHRDDAASWSAIPSFGIGRIQVEVKQQSTNHSWPTHIQLSGAPQWTA